MKTIKFIFKNAIVNLIVIFLLFLGIVLLRVQNLSLKHDITRRQEDAAVRKQKIATFETDLEFGNRLEGSSFPVQLLKPISGEEPVRDIFSNSKYSVFIIFTHFDCQTCLDQELRLWQSFNQKFSNDNIIAIRGIANTQDSYKIYIQTRAIVTFPIFKDAEGENAIFSQLDIQKGPVVLLVDNKNKQIIYTHSVEMNNIKKSELFLEKVKRFLG